ncbi:uncharacterized protein A4U43_C10F16460 [Asparagus officinalis]|uniref:HSF-type DNA-binding domain-containing protein n=1 Tax=Asparagus officinalis TaxID=4686 RepID=A0A5P1E6K8_ASPOF|nr:heat stress transcription factor B-2a-like [Asparagus officinalis]ONK57085.1 uncharacterized protein A4U43_C10F16460 [Asparagus officinalis]
MTSLSKLRSLAPFLSKTYDLVEESRDSNDVVSWNEEGSGFVVWSPEEFSRFVLPRYFKHCNFSSFIRQLNTYGFKKASPDRWEFRHEKFQKGKRCLLSDITRRRCKPSVFPSFLRAREKKSSAAEINENEMLEQNKMLQKENEELRSQIAYYGELETSLQKLLSQYVCSR